jgi:hypothetical protein
MTSDVSIGPTVGLQNGYDEDMGGRFANVHLGGGDGVGADADVFTGRSADQKRQVSGFAVGPKAGVGASAWVGPTDAVVGPKLPLTVLAPVLSPMVPSLLPPVRRWIDCYMPQAADERGKARLSFASRESFRRVAIGAATVIWIGVISIPPWFDEKLRATSSPVSDPASGRLFLLHLKPDGFVTAHQYRIHAWLGLVDAFSVVLVLGLAFFALGRARKLRVVRGRGRISVRAE